MMKKLSTIFLLCCLTTVIKLQAQEWVKVNPVFIPTASQYTYYGYFVDQKHGWWDVGMAGPGSIYHTLNGGITWQKQLDSNEVGCSDMKFIDTLHGWYVGRVLPGNTYKILITKDGGKTWQRNSTPVIACITFFDSLNGFAGGDTIYSTTDGGITWEPTEVDSGPRFGIHDIYFSDKKYGWAVGGSSTFWDAGIILKSTNGGKYWNVIQHPSSIYGHAVYSTDSLHGYVVGSNPPFFYGVIQVTSDGGNSWLIHYLPGTWLNDVVFTNDSTGWAVGDYGFIWHSSDRGVNWIQVESGTTSHLYRIFFFNEGRIGYIFGADSTLLKYDKTVDIKEEKKPSPTSFKLFQNYPNPFNPTTTIEFQTPENGLVSLAIYDLLGKEVRTLVNEEKRADNYTVTWNGKDEHGKDVSSGIYFYQLKESYFNQVRKLIFIK